MVLKWSTEAREESRCRRRCHLLRQSPDSQRLLKRLVKGRTLSGDDRIRVERFGRDRFRVENCGHDLGTGKDESRKSKGINGPIAFFIGEGEALGAGRDELRGADSI